MPVLPPIDTLSGSEEDVPASALFKGSGSDEDVPARAKPRAKTKKVLPGMSQPKTATTVKAEPKAKSSPKAASSSPKANKAPSAKGNAKAKSAKGKASAAKNKAVAATAALSRGKSSVALGEKGEKEADAEAVEECDVTFFL